MSTMFTTCGKLSVNHAARVVFAGAIPVELTRAEFDVFNVLAKAKNHILPRQEILFRVYGANQPEPKILDVLICKARKKLAKATQGENYLETVWGEGYVLRDPIA